MRLVTRGDFDGLTCAVLITSCEEIEELQLAHPQDITDNRLHISDDDIIANLPYHPGCSKWFDHQLLTEPSMRPSGPFVGRYGIAPSAARMVYEHYLIDQPGLQRHERLVAETDRFNSAQLSYDDVVDPQGYVLLGFTMDPRTGLGAFRDYFRKLVEWLKEKPIEEVLEELAVSERIDTIRDSADAFRELVLENSRLEGNVVVTDFRDIAHAPVGNRFLVYTCFPQANVSLRLHPGPSREHVACVVGHSIFNRTCRVPLGPLMARFGGGGQYGAGTCLLPAEQADALVAEIVTALRQGA